MLIRFLCSLPIVAAQSLLSQTTCGNLQFRLVPDYSFAIGNSSGGSTYTFTVGGKSLAQGPLPQLALFHYDGSAVSTSGILPNGSSGVTYVNGKWGQALAIAAGGLLTYPASCHMGFTDGTIELWIAPPPVAPWLGV